MRWLAVGLATNGDVWNLPVDKKVPQEVANLLQNKSPRRAMPVQILILKNDQTCPRVVEHWILGEEYKEEEQ
jgi:hypothetical protein